MDVAVAKVAIPDSPGEMPVNYALPNVRKVTPLMAKLGALAEGARIASRRLAAV